MNASTTRVVTLLCAVSFIVGLGVLADRALAAPGTPGDCCSTYTIEDPQDPSESLTAEHCTGYGCEDDEVCVAFGGTTQSGKPWARASCLNIDG